MTRRKGSMGEGYTSIAKIEQISSPSEIVYHDVGCRYYHSCLSCPLSECVYDMEQRGGHRGHNQAMKELEALGLPPPKPNRKRVNARTTTVLAETGIKQGI